jgi:hypothetical protein
MKVLGAVGRHVRVNIYLLELRSETQSYPRSCKYKEII